MVRIELSVCLWICRSSLHILGVTPLLRHMVRQRSLCSVRSLFTLWMVCFDARTFSICMWSNLPVFTFVTRAFGVLSEK